MIQKIIKLEGTLEKSELELKECNKQVESLNEKLHTAKQEISQLKKETERTQQRMKEMENVLDDDTLNAFNSNSDTSPKPGPNSLNPVFTNNT
ncbi:Coiled-coil domain-containing protein 18 [Microtus ochrogaster]|uniref:Coiled-coil domain-containing protein 18 n=1 Tax=Microtus ochrogaster TaxID=79684 RepID=A0A8J6L8Y1_MICOH|nr:Coiled-coil domain-containing protein 18 [Microtus ochrogaster]